MASSPGLSQEQQLQQQFSQHLNHRSSNNGHHLTNGPANGARHQQDEDAIVPASDPDDDSTDEDDEYNSYMQKQEQQQQQFQKKSKAEFDTAEEHEHEHEHEEEDEDDEDQYHHQQQQQQPQPHHHQHQHLQQIQQQYQLQQQQHLHAYKSQAMNIQQLLHQDQNQDQDMSGADSHEEEEYYQHNPQHDPNLQRQRDIEMLRQHDDDDDDDDEFDDDDEEEEEDEEDQIDEEMMDEDEDEGSEVMSLTEDDIDFNLVYAFHTFVATQEGQASVVRNDSLMLLEDVNVYWWLVRVLKTGVIGYIPAENIETPFERLARLNTYRNVTLSAPSPEWGTFDEHVQPLDPAILEQRAMNRRSVVFTAQNEFLEASETEWTEEEEEGDWYDDEEDEEEDEEHDVDEDHDMEDIDGEEHDDLESHEGSQHSVDHNQYADRSQKTPLQLEAERVQQEILNDQKKLRAIAASHKMDIDQDSNRHSQQSSKGEEEEDEEDEDEVQVTNRYRKPLLDEDDLLFSNTEPRVISLTPPIARDDTIVNRIQTPPGKARNLSMADEPPKQQSQQQQSQPQSQPQPPASSTSGVRSPSLDSDEEEREKMMKKMVDRKDAKLNSLLGKGEKPVARKTKEEYEEGLPPEAVVVKKPGKFKSLFGVGKSSKEKERKEKERQEKERLKNLAKNPSSSSNSGIGSNLFRARSNSNGSVGSSITGPSSSSTLVPQSPVVDKADPPTQEIMTLRVYPGNVDFGASMYKTVVVTPATMSSEVAHQAVIKFRLAPDGTASTGDFYLTVKGVDGDETILQATDKPMSIYLSLTAHLTTPLPVNHRLSISSVSSMMSVNSTASQTSSTNNNNSSPSTALPGQRRSGSGKAEQPRSIRFLLNKKIRRASSITNSASASSLPATPTTPTTPQEDFFWVKVVCQAQDLPQSMLLLEGMGTAMDKADPRTQGQSVATKVEHWIPMHSTSNAGDVIFRTLESVGIRAGVVDGVQEHILVAKRTTVPNGLVIEYQLGLYLNSNTSKKHKQGEEIPLPPQTPLIRCFEEHQLVPVRRSPKADVASMPLHPDHVFFLRKAAKSLQAEMRFVQEQQQSQQQQSQAKKAPSPLLTPSFRAADSDGTLSAQPSPTHSLTGMLSPTSPGPQTRNFNPANAALMNASRLGGGNPAGSSPIRIPRRTDSVIMSPTSPLVRGDSFDHSSGRPSPTLSTQSLMTAQPIHPPQTSRTPTPDRHQFQQHQQQQQQQQQVRTRSPSVSQGSPTSLARPLQAPSPAPSNMSSHADQQEGSRSSTPERSYRPERQRATSPSLTHGPSPLSLSAVMAQSEQMGSSATRKASFASIDELLSPSTPSVRLNMRRNTTQGVDIVLNKGTVRSARTTSSPSQTAQYQYSFVPLEGGEEIDITEIIEDVLGGDSDDEHDDQQARRSRDDSQELETMSRRERIAAAVARASQAVAAGKERRRASASSGSISASFSVVSRSRRSISATSDRDRLEQLGSSARGGETLLKLERALAGENSAGATDGKQSSATGRNLPSPMSLLSSPSSPTLARKASDADVQIASVTAVGSAPGRNQSTVSVLAAAAAAASASAAAVGIIGSTGSSSPGPASPSSSSGYTRATLLSNINASAPSQKVAGSSPSSPSAMFASSPNSQYQQYPLEGRSYSPLPRPLQTPSPASSTRPNLLQLSIHTGASTVGVSSAGGPASASTVESNASPQFRSGNAGAGTGELQNSNIRNRSSSTSATEITRRGSTASSSTTTSSAPTSKVGGDGDLYAASASESKATTPTTGALQQNDPWLLSSDYNTGMQDLLTLVRGGRSSSVGTGAPSSLRGPGGITYGKDGRILPPPSSAPSSMNHPTRQRLLSLQPHNVPPPSSHSLYNTKNTGGTNNTSLNNVNNNKDTQAHDQHLDETHTNSNYSTTTNDKLHLTTRNNNIFNLATGNETIHEEDEESDEPMIWTRTERRLRDVQGECHPEVFECWKEVDAELDKVGRELDSLLATVKATIF